MAVPSFTVGWIRERLVYGCDLADCLLLVIARYYVVRQQSDALDGRDEQGRGMARK